MSENGNGQKVQVGTIALTITLDQTTGQVNVNGPIDNGLLCYGLLEAAKDAIRQYAAQKASGQRIVPAGTIPFLKQ